jgi:hypothetical protein
LRPAKGLRLAALAALVACCAACDNTITPITDDPEALFAVYGFLDTAADTQFVRVEALRATVLDPGGAPLDAEVSSTDLGTGERVTWSDSIIVLDDGTMGHLFFAAFQPRVGNTYRLEIRRPDGRATQATTKIPPVPDVFVSSPMGDTLTLAQRIILKDIRDIPFHVSMQYQVGVEPEQRKTIDISYENAGDRAATGWQIEIQLVRDRGIILGRLNRVRFDRSVLFFGLNMVVSLLSHEWQAGPTFNITNGEGFFGAISRAELTWKLTTADVNKIGFVDQQ